MNSTEYLECDKYGILQLLVGNKFLMALWIIRRSDEER